MMKTERRIRVADYAKLLKTPGKHNDGGSLYLVVRGPTSARWEYQIKDNGVVTSLWGGTALGDFGVSLSDARTWRDNKRNERYHARRNGMATAATGRPAAAGVTFAEAITKWLEANAGKWADKSRKARAGLASLSLAPLDVARITQADVLDALKGETPRQHVDKRGWLADLFSWCKVQGWRTGNNPADFDADTLRNLPKIEKEGQKHHARVSRDDVPSLYASIVDGDTARALRFLILTAARSGDVEGATWSEIHPKGATFINEDGDEEKLICDAWIIPAERTKERKQRIVPLPSQAVAILDKRGTDDALLFGKLASNAMLNLLQKTHPEKTVHGMRSVFRDWAIRQPAVPLEHGASMRDLAELQQGHELPKASAVEKAYARNGLYDLRAPLMERWAAFATAS